jgi:hypothetical protein
MGVTYYSRIVCGFKITTSNVMKTVTRFDNISGEPYKEEVFDYLSVLCGAVEIERISDMEDLDNEHGLGIHYIDDDSDEYIYGVTTCERGVYDIGCEVVKNIHPEAVEKYSALKSLKPEFYLMLITC